MGLQNLRKIVYHRDLALQLQISRGLRSGRERRLGPQPALRQVDRLLAAAACELLANESGQPSPA